MKYHVDLDINGITFMPSFVKIYQEDHRQVELGVYTTLKYCRACLLLKKNYKIMLQ